MSDQHQPELSDAELEAILASLNTDDINVSAPPASVWEGIEAQLSDPSVTSTSITSVSSVRPTRAEPTGATSPRPSAQRPQTRSRSSIAGSSVTPTGDTRRGRSSTTMTWLAAAAAVVIVVAGIFVVSQRGDDTRVIATAQLAYEDGFDAAGATASASATLLKRDGRYQIRLADPDLPTDLGEPADLELWLIEKRADGSLDVQPVAVIDNGDGTFSVPDGLDPETHDIVDISIEPRDGDATHSGRSILRGTLVKA